MIGMKRQKQPRQKAMRPTARLSLNPDDLTDGYRLRREDDSGKVTGITLSRDDVLHLARSMSQFAHQMLAQDQQPVLSKDPTAI